MCVLTHSFEWACVIQARVAETASKHTAAVDASAAGKQSLVDLQTQLTDKTAEAERLKKTVATQSRLLAENKKEKERVRVTGEAGSGSLAKPALFVNTATACTRGRLVSFRLKLTTAFSEAHGAYCDGCPCTHTLVCEVRSPHRGWLAAGLMVSHQAAVFEA